LETDQKFRGYLESCWNYGSSIARIGEKEVGSSKTPSEKTQNPKRFNQGRQLSGGNLGVGGWGRIPLGAAKGQRRRSALTRNGSIGEAKVRQEEKGRTRQGMMIRQ